MARAVNPTTDGWPAIIRDAFGPQHVAKRAARAGDVTVKAAEAWLAGTRRPSAETLLRMSRESERLRANLIRMMQPRVKP